MGGLSGGGVSAGLGGERGCIVVVVVAWIVVVSERGSVPVRP